MWVFQMQVVNATLTIAVKMATFQSLRSWCVQITREAHFKGRQTQFSPIIQLRTNNSTRDQLSLSFTSYACPTYSTSATDNYENIKIKTWRISVNDRIITDKVEQILTKGEIVRHEQFLLLPQCCQKSSAAEISKCCYMRERVNAWSNNVFPRY